MAYSHRLADELHLKRGAEIRVASRNAGADAIAAAVCEHLQHTAYQLAVPGTFSNTGAAGWSVARGEHAGFHRRPVRLIRSRVFIFSALVLFLQPENAYQPCCDMPAEGTAVIIGRACTFRIHIPVGINGQRCLIALQSLNLCTVNGVFKLVIVFYISQPDSAGIVISTALIQRLIAAQQPDYPLRHIISHN
ncbi:hypothetical protein D3C75_500270 [compost metagenome]